MQKKTIRLNESQLRKIIKESVKKALMNEISSDMIGRTIDKFKEKYGNPHMYKDGVNEPLLKNPSLKTDRDGKYASALHPKDNRPLYSHLDDLKDAHYKRQKEEALEDPIVGKAQEIYDSHIRELEIEPVDRVDNYAWEVNLWMEVDDENGGTWRFDGGGVASNSGGWSVDEVTEMEFEAPDGTTGSIPMP